MNTKKKFILVAIFSFTILFISCEKNNNFFVSTTSVQSGICIDTALIDSTAMCYEIYEPVCGCNGFTYSNSCYADISGLTSYVIGECCD